MINYNNKKFRVVANTVNGETGSNTVFLYKQNGNIITAEYNGGKIIKGHLIAVVNETGMLDMRYHQVNDDNQLMTGICRSTPEILADGRIRLHEHWQWTSGDLSIGESVIEEIID